MACPTNAVRPSVRQVQRVLIAEFCVARRNLDRAWHGVALQLTEALVHRREVDRLAEAGQYIVNFFSARRRRDVPRRAPKRYTERAPCIRLV